MTTRLSRERARRRDALDHLHTRRPSSPGSRARRAVDAAPPTRVARDDVGASTPRRRASTREPAARRRAASRAGAARAPRSAPSCSPARQRRRWRAAPRSRATNPRAQLRAWRSAPRRSSAPSAGLALHAGVVGIASDPVRPGLLARRRRRRRLRVRRRRASSARPAASTLNAPIVGIAATPDGRGYWLVGADGGVFAFGDASFEGSIAGMPLAAPITAIVPTTRRRTATGSSAPTAGSSRSATRTSTARPGASQLASPIVGAAATPTGHGYWLARRRRRRLRVRRRALPRLAARPARTRRSASPLAPTATATGSPTPTAACAASARPPSGNAVDASTRRRAPRHRRHRGERPRRLLARAGRGRPDRRRSPNDPFLACTRAHESDSAGGYHAVSPGGTYRGAYQFDQSTWNSAAQLAGRADLVGVDPAPRSRRPTRTCSRSTLFHARGAQPWGGRCGGSRDR